MGGGWPTVRYFNKETGYGGKPYEEKSGASLCDVKDTSKGCSDQQSKFISKWSDKPKEELQKQLDRLKGMADKDGSSMKAEALKWIKQRIGIFQQLSKEEL